MRYKGKLVDIQELDKVLLRHSVLVQCTGERGDYKAITSEQSACQRKRYRVSINGRFAIVKLDFDTRTKEGMIEVRDDNAWHVALKMPEFDGMMARLYPVYRRRGEMLQAIDKLMGVQNEQLKQTDVVKADVLNKSTRNEDTKDVSIKTVSDEESVAITSGGL